MRDLIIWPVILGAAAWMEAVGVKNTERIAVWLEEITVLSALSRIKPDSVLSTVSSAEEVQRILAAQKTKDSGIFTCL